MAFPPGALVIDHNAQPRFTLDVGSLWSTTLTASCPGRGGATVPFDVPGRLIVEGTLDGGVSSITGSETINGVVWEWAPTSML